jgi:hypothetical protein
VQLGAVDEADDIAYFQALSFFQAELNQGPGGFCGNDGFFRLEGACGVIRAVIASAGSQQAKQGREESFHEVC